MHGLRIVVTRAAHQAEELAAPLRDLGADVILLPAIAIAPPADPQPLIDAARNANNYDWIVFTSANAVEAFAQHLERPPQNPRIAVIGAATREAAAEHGFHVSLVPEQYTAESLVESFASQNPQNKRILVPQAAGARDLLTMKLRELGARVDIVEAYSNVLPESSAARAREVFCQPVPDWVLLASPSAVENLARMCGTEILHQVKLGSIGPITSAAILHLGLIVHAEAEPHTVAGLVEAVLRTHMASCKQPNEDP